MVLAGLLFIYCCVGVMVSHRFAKPSCRNALQVRFLYTAFKKPLEFDSDGFFCLGKEIFKDVIKMQGRRQNERHRHK